MKLRLRDGRDARFVHNGLVEGCERNPIYNSSIICDDKELCKVEYYFYETGNSVINHKQLNHNGIHIEKIEGDNPGLDFKSFKTVVDNLVYLGNREFSYLRFKKDNIIKLVDII